MKKYFLLATMAVVAVALISCDKKKDEEPTPVPTPQEAKIVLSENELDLPQGYKYQLVATITPANNTATITWTSTDESIAPVDEDGYVYGVAYGTAKIIASAEGVKADTCVVTVYDPHARFMWAGWDIWNLNKDDAKNPIILNDTPEYVHLTSGDSIRCVLASAYAFIWGEGIDLIDQDHLEGAGYIAKLDTVPVYVISEEPGSKYAQYNGKFIGSNYLEVVKYSEFSTDSAYTAAAAILIDPTKHFEYITGQGEEKGIDGAYLTWMNTDDDEDYYPYEGLLGTGIYAYINDELFYNSIVGWSDGLYGLAIDQQGAPVQPYTFANFKAYQYKLLPSQGAPAKAPRQAGISKSYTKTNATKLNVKAINVEKQNKAPFQIAK